MRIPRVGQFFLRSRWLRVLLVLFLVYKVFFNTFVANRFVPWVIQKTTLMSWQGNFTTFSLFYGVEIEDLKLTAGIPFSDEAFFTADALRIRYNIPYLLLGKVSLSNLELQKGFLHLKEKGGVWNISRIVPPSEEKKEEEPTNEPLTEIRTYLPLQIYTKLHIEDFHFRLDQESGGTKSFGLDHLHFHFELDSNRFVSLPLSVSIFDQIDLFLLEVNPNLPLSVSYQSDQVSFQENIPFRSVSQWDRKESPPVFLSSWNIGKPDFQMAVKGRPMGVGFPLLADAKYQPDTDQLNISEFLMEILGSDWLQVQGTVNNVSREDKTVTLKVQKSDIRLDPVQKVLSSLVGIIPSINLGGNLSLTGTESFGSWSKLNSKIVLNGQNVLFKLGSAKMHKVPLIQLDLESLVDLTAQKEPTAGEPFPILQKLKSNSFHINYNGADILLSLIYQTKQNLKVDLKIDKLQLSDFVNGISGKTTLETKVDAKDFSELPIDFSLYIDSFRYLLDRSRSPDSKIVLTSRSNLKFSDPLVLSEMWVQIQNLEQRTIGGANAAKIDGNLDLRFGQETQIQVNPLNLQFTTGNVSLVLPLVLREKLTTLESLLGNSPKLKLESKVTLSESHKEIQTKLAADLPGIEIHDLLLSSKVKISGKASDRIQIQEMKVSAFGNRLLTNLSGELNKRNSTNPPLGPYFGNLDINVSLKSPEKKYFSKGFSFQGDLGLFLKINDYKITGEFVSKESNFFKDNQKCPSDSCEAYYAQNVNAKIPIEHSLDFGPRESLIVGDKSIFIKGYGRTMAPNITIGSVVGTHPNIPNVPFDYIKKHKEAPGFTSFIEYKENFLNLESLRANTLDGVVLGKNLLFNLGSLDPKQMEFRGNFLIRDIDLRQLMNPKIRSKIDDGKLKADLNIEVRDLSEPIANLDLFFSIFQIGKDFGKSALNVISPQNFLMDRITDSYSIKKIDVTLSKGLVYADVYFNRSLLSLFVNLEDGKISQQRMPLANFLKRAQSEIEAYQE